MRKRFYFERRLVLAVSLILSVTAVGWANSVATQDLEAASPIKIQVFTATFIDTTLGSETLTQLPSPVFLYKKKSPTSILRITYQDTVANQGPGASTCVYQVRVDGSPGSPGNEFSSPILVASNLVNTSFTSAGIFSGVSSGTHEISFWHRQVAATQCLRNSGGFVTTVIVEEFELSASAK